MNCEKTTQVEETGIDFFEKYLTVWVLLCIAVGIVLGKLEPGFAKSLDSREPRLIIELKQMQAALYLCLLQQTTAGRC